MCAYLAQYIEANETLSKKDFNFRVKISRKEAKETIYWLKLGSETNNKVDKKNANELFNEATELKKIFYATIEKSK